MPVRHHGKKTEEKETRLGILESRRWIAGRLNTAEGRENGKPSQSWGAPFEITQGEILSSGLGEVREGEINGVKRKERKNSKDNQRHCYEKRTWRGRRLSARKRTWMEDMKGPMNMPGLEFPLNKIRRARGLIGCGTMGRKGGEAGQTTVFGKVDLGREMTW